ncbi:MAG: hypothetical protein JNM79_13995 [Burkholderiales bacterium]|nr:hypothetical protein [Burkholderiales bacterium]
MASLCIARLVDGDAISSYEFWDSAGAGYFAINGVAQAAGQAIPVTGTGLGNLRYVGAPSPQSETLWVRANDGQAWSPWAGWSQATIA